MAAINQTTPSFISWLIECAMVTVSEPSDFDGETVITTSGFFYWQAALPYGCSSQRIRQVKRHNASIAQIYGLQLHDQRNRLYCCFWQYEQHDRPDYFYLE